MEFQKLFDTLPNSGIPERMHGGIIRYIEYGIFPGTFLQAIITNNLRDAFAWCDDESCRIIDRYITWFCTEVPNNAWGTEKKMLDWIDTRQWNMIPRRKLITIDTGELDNG